MATRANGRQRPRIKRAVKYKPLARALEILQMMAADRDGVSVSAVSRETRLAKSAAHRLLTTLVDEGYARQDPVSERYELTLRLPALGFRFLGINGLTDVVQPILDRLAAETGELVQFGLVEGDRLIWVAWAQGSRAPLRYVPVLGREIILYTTGSGAVWLARKSDQEALRIMHAQGFVRGSTPGYGRKAVRDDAEFLAKLNRVRRDGYGLNLEEGEPGINAIAVAVRSDLQSQSPVVATIAIAGPSIRVTKKRLLQMLPGLRSAAREMTEVWPMRRHLDAAAAGPARPATPLPSPTAKSSKRTTTNASAAKRT
jgi:IclR family acetate operon transcriptional repressor